MRLHHALIMVCVFAASGFKPAAAHEFVDNAKVTPLMSQVLAGMPGKVGSMLVVEYPPGGKTDKHRHPGAHTFVYVLDGELEFQVAGKDAVKLGPGQTYYESPADIHAVSRNVSATKPARFLVVFVQDEGKAPVEPVE